MGKSPGGLGWGPAIDAFETDFDSCEAGFDILPARAECLLVVVITV